MCPDCLASIQPTSRKVCAICGDRLFSSYAQRDDDGLRRCPVCRRVRRPFDRAVAYGGYEGELRELIHLLKSNGVRPAAKVLGGFLAEALAALEPGIEQLTFEQPVILIIPVPLYKRKLRERGFNQAELIARAALKVFSCERAFPACHRPVAAHPRHNLSDRLDQPSASRQPARCVCGRACLGSHWPPGDSGG